VGVGVGVGVGVCVCVCRCVGVCTRVKISSPRALCYALRSCTSDVLAHVCTCVCICMCVCAHAFMSFVHPCRLPCLPFPPSPSTLCTCSPAARLLGLQIDAAINAGESLVPLPVLNPPLAHNLTVSLVDHSRQALPAAPGIDQPLPSSLVEQKE